MTYPLTDEYMFYDYEEHRYILTPKYVLDKLAIDLKMRLNMSGTFSEENLASAVLDQLSREVYQYIYNQSNQNDFQEYVLAKTEDGRKVIKDAMREQVLYFLANGDLSQYSGVNVAKGNVMPEFYERTISPNAKKVLTRVIPEIGTSIVYEGHYPFIFKKDYVKMGY